VSSGEAAVQSLVFHITTNAIYHSFHLRRNCISAARLGPGLPLPRNRGRMTYGGGAALEKRPQGAWLYAVQEKLSAASISGLAGEEIGYRQLIGTGGSARKLAE
jgi:hypothetical protein